MRIYSYAVTLWDTLWKRLWAVQYVILEATNNTCGETWLSCYLESKKAMKKAKMSINFLQMQWLLWNRAETAICYISELLHTNKKACKINQIFKTEKFWRSKKYKLFYTVIWLKNHTKKEKNINETTLAIQSCKIQKTPNASKRCWDG